MFHLFSIFDDIVADECRERRRQRLLADDEDCITVPAGSISMMEGMYGGVRVVQEACAKRNRIS